MSVNQEYLLYYKNCCMCGAKHKWIHSGWCGSIWSRNTI